MLHHHYSYEYHHHFTITTVTVIQNPLFILSLISDRILCLLSSNYLLISINYGAMVDDHDVEYDVEDDDDADNDDTLTQAYVKCSLYYLKLQYNRSESKFV
jgi:hypothetical protein